VVLLPYLEVVEVEVVVVDLQLLKELHPLLLVVL